VRVWIVDNDHWQRACLRAELIERGHDAIGFETVADAVTALPRAGRFPPDLVVVTVADGWSGAQPLADAAHRATPPVPLLAVAPAAAPAPPAHPPVWAAVLHRPLTVGQIADAVPASMYGRRL
jgi:DNA-binding NtrC family response regulator